LRSENNESPARDLRMHMNSVRACRIVSVHCFYRAEAAKQNQAVAHKYFDMLIPLLQRLHDEKCQRDKE
jgi:hypothetical protein